MVSPMFNIIYLTANIEGRENLQDPVLAAIG